MAATLARARVMVPMRPDRYLRMGVAMARGGSITAGFAAAAQRCGDRAGLIDEFGSLTWKNWTAGAMRWAPRCRTCPAPTPPGSA